MKYSYFIAFTYQKDGLKVLLRARPDIFFIIYIHVERYQLAISLHYRIFEEGLVKMDSIWTRLVYVLEKSKFLIF